MHDQVGIRSCCQKNLGAGIEICLQKFIESSSIVTDCDLLPDGDE
jgi:hypothetical protein